MAQRIWALVYKEFLALLLDRKSRIVLIVPPLIQLIVFSHAATFDLNRVPVAVYNEDGSPASRDLVAAFSGSPTFHIVARPTREQDIAPLIDGKTALLVLHIGRHFGRDLLLGRPASVQVIVDGRNSNTAATLVTYTRKILDGFNRAWAESHGRPGPPARLEMRAWFNPNLESQWFIVPGIVGLLTLVVTMLVTAFTVAREREQGTFEQLLVTPFRPVEILIGKALPGLVIGLVEASLIIVVAVAWFRVPLVGSLPALYLGLALFLLSAIGVGLMLSSLAVTQQQALLGAFLFMVPAILLSGFATPIANMPPVVQELTRLNPLRYFMIVLRGVFLEDAPVSLLARQYWPMAVIGLACLGLAGWLFRHRLG